MVKKKYKITFFPLVLDCGEKEKKKKKEYNLFHAH